MSSSLNAATTHPASIGANTSVLLPVPATAAHGSSSSSSSSSSTLAVPTDAAAAAAHSAITAVSPLPPADDAAAAVLAATAVDVRGLGANLHPAALRASTAHIRDPAAVRAKLARIAAGGLRDLYCVSDFDATMTTPEGLSSWCVLERSHFTSEAYRARTRELFNTYYPCEIDPALSHAQRVGKMVEWWGLAQAALVAEKLPEGIFARMVTAVEDKITFRSRCATLLRLCEAADVPFLVFSAGIANVIEDVLQRKGLLSANMHVISNVVGFKDGLAAEFTNADGPIHVFNKHDGLVRGTAFEQHVTSRRNVLLLGDSLGDVTMSNDAQHDAGAVLRVGYLNTGVGKKVENHLKAYAEAFDVVLVGDNTMEFALRVLRLAKGEVSVEEIMALNANVDIDAAVAAASAATAATAGTTATAGATAAAEEGKSAAQ